MKEKKKCLKCGKKFTQNRTYHLFCTTKCCNAYNKGKTWDNYYKKLLQNGKARELLTPEILLKLHEKQDGICAMSGVKLTKITGKGMVSTNASIDRVNASGPYTEENIRLVCVFVNGFRNNLTDKDFVWWCNKIAEYNSG